MTAIPSLPLQNIMIPALSRFTHPSGICRYALNLASCLAETLGGANIWVAVGDWQEEYFRDLRGNRGSVNLIPVRIANNSRRRNWWYLNELPSLAQKMNCEIIHCSFPAPVRRGAFSGLIVTTVHDMYAFDFPENFGYPAVLFNRAFFRQALRASDGVVCDSQETMGRFVHYFPRFQKTRKAAVVPCCVDLSHVKPQAPDAKTLETKEPFVLCVGQHRKNKNIDLLISAFAALKSSPEINRKLRLLIVGSTGPETANLKQLASSLLPVGSIQYASGLADNELAWLYQHCRLLVLPSSQEGFCLPLVEGMHMGAPIVCSDIPILREVGSDACIYFELKNAPEALVAAMRRGLIAPRTDYGEAIRRFSPTVVAQQQVAFYRQLGKDYAAGKTPNHAPVER